MKQVTVVIPLYKSEHSACEMFSIRQTCHILRQHPITIVHPDGLDTSALKEEFPNVAFTSFDRRFFGSIDGYNELMMSSIFYERFLDSEYILICQPDAYIFRDELLEWCQKGYDYVAAPWVRRDVYDRPLARWYMALDKWLTHRKGMRCRQDLFGRVGNGGLSLRKVSSHLSAIPKYQDRINYYLTHPQPFFAEDTFWSLEVEEFRYPEWKEALLFSFDKDPDYCYFLTDGQLPFGCHAWYKGQTRHFWFYILGMEPYSKQTTRYPL